MKLINKIMKTKAIHKFILPMKEESTIRLPYGANIIKGENQDGFVAIWDISEFTGIGLGKYAPIVFGWLALKVRSYDTSI